MLEKLVSNMNNNIKIYREVLNSIYKSCWLEIKYHNKENTIKKFWVCIKDIDFSEKKLTCKSLSLDDKKEEIKEITVRIENILEARILENTCFENNDYVIKKMQDNYFQAKEMFPSYEYENVLLYYEECLKNDIVPFKTDLEKVLNIDKTVLMGCDEYKLNKDQITILKRHFSSSIDNNSKHKQIGLTLLTIKYPNNKHYVLAYLPVKWDIEKQVLIKLSEEPIYNKKFKESDSIDAEEWQISEYLTEDQQELLKDFNKNYEVIYKILSKKLNNPRESIDDTPELVFIERNKSVDIQIEYDGIRKMYCENKVSKPISAFFGELDETKSKFDANGFCLLNKQLNPSQLLSIFLAMKEDVSFVQGPPGTGKTSTVVNTVTTAFYNRQKILVVTNNNKPMKDLDKKFSDLSMYKNEKIELPICRLSAKDKMPETIKNMNHLYHKYKDARVNDDILKKNSEFQKQNLKEVIEKMNEIDEHIKQKRRIKVIDNFVNRTQDQAARLSMLFQISKNDSIKELDASEINEKVNQTENTIKSFLYFYSAKCLQKLDDPLYSEIKTIIDIDITDNKQVDESVEKLIGFIKEKENLELLLDVFPIVLSTNISANKLAVPEPIFDICIMDEAGQCNVATSLIPIIRAKRLMLVGDIQQLKPVILLNDLTNETLKNNFSIESSFCYLSNSIYSTLNNNASIYRESLLDEHYRCNEKIIDFCNRKYYQGKLILKGKNNSEIPLEFVNIESKILSNDKNVSLDEVKETIRILQREDIKDKQVGIITPYVVQKKVLEKEIKRQIKNVDYDIGTIHTFQGDEKDTIIFSTAITNKTTTGTYNWLKSNKQLINVAVSRAINKLILLCDEAALRKLHEKTINHKKDDIFELYEHINTQGRATITPNTIQCEALGTEEEGTIIDQQAYNKIAVALSIISDRAKYQEKVPYNELIEEIDVDGRFDFVIYNNGEDRDIAVQIVKLSQKESNYTKLIEMCKKKEIELLLIHSKEMRSYFSIKDLLKQQMKKKQNRKQNTQKQHA